MKQSKTFSSGFSVEETIEFLRQQLADCREAIQVLSSTANEKQRQLAASQSYAQQLMEALLEISQVACELSPEQKISNEALALPQDTSALEAMIAEAGEVMRERCSDSAQAEMDEQNLGSAHWHAARACREAIRDIPGVTLEDVQKGIK